MYMYGEYIDIATIPFFTKLACYTAKQSTATYVHAYMWISECEMCILQPTRSEYLQKHVLLVLCMYVYLLL